MCLFVLQCQHITNKTLKEGQLPTLATAGVMKEIFICPFHPAGLADTIPVIQLPVIPHRNADTAFLYSFPIPTITRTPTSIFPSVQTGRELI